MNNLTYAAMRWRVPRPLIGDLIDAGRNRRLSPEASGHLERFEEAAISRLNPYAIPGTAPSARARYQGPVPGMNPSFVTGVLTKHRGVVHPEVPASEALEHLKWEGPLGDAEWTARRDAIVKLDQHSRNNYARYYGPFEKLALRAGAGMSWQHLDAFPLRLTKQVGLAPFLPDGQPEKPEWQPLRRLLDATVDLARAMKPKVIVVANSRLSKALELHLELQLRPNGHRYTTHLFPGVPFLLSSQLSGGATSKYGLERLVADLRDVLCGGQGLRWQRATLAARSAAKVRAKPAASSVKLRRGRSSP